MTVQVSISTTPNENALKFTVNKKVIESGYKTFNNLEEAKEHPLAAKLFETAGLASVFLMPDFITVTKKAEADWSHLQEKIVKDIQAIL